MAQRGHGVATDTADEREMRDQEVLRANRELAAYFKGRRTEREARAALKIIKAYVRDRERRDPKSRPPFPALRAKVQKVATSRKTARDAGVKRRRKPHRDAHPKSPRTLTASAEPQATENLVR